MQREKTIIIMETSYHFTSAQEFTPAILESIRRVYQEKPISIYIHEDVEPFVPQWQMQEVRRRNEITGNNPAHLLDSNTVFAELERELAAI